MAVVMPLTHSNPPKDTPKGEFNISLSGQGEQIYSTRSPIQGHLDLNFKRDARVHDLTLTFDGVTSTYVQNEADNGPARGRATGKHTFLKLEFPIGVEALPEDFLAKAGTIHMIPFNFVVPDKILPQTCSHYAASRNVKEAHLLLPPTLNGSSDFAPDMAKIIYVIRAQIVYQYTDSDVVQAVNKSVEVRVIPAREEEPPLMTVAEGGSEYSLRREKVLKSGSMKKVGQIVAESSQPPSLDLPRKKTAGPLTTTLALKLRYDPVKDEDLPPRLSIITTRIRIFTIYGAAPFEQLSGPSPAITRSGIHGVDSNKIDLPNQNVPIVDWKRQEYGLASMANDTSIAAASSAYKFGAPFYIATVPVTITLPNQYGMTGPVRIVPTFYSCLVSRCYAIEISTSFHMAHSKAGSSIVLTVPVQVTAESNAETEGAVPVNAAAIAEIDRVFSFHQDGHMSPDYDDQHPSAIAMANPSVPGDALPSYVSDAAGSRGEGSQANRQSVSTRYEVQPQEWQNIGTGIKWVYRKIQSHRAKKSQD